MTDELPRQPLHFEMAHPTINLRYIERHVPHAHTVTDLTAPGFIKPVHTTERVLQQAWLVETFKVGADPNYGRPVSARHEWRDVPTVKEPS